MMTNFTKTRADIRMTDQSGSTIENMTYTNRTEGEYENGDNVLDIENKQYKFVLNGMDSPDRRTLKMTAYECIVDCGPEEIVEEELSDELKYWSNPEHWPSGAVPVDGDSVVIDSGVNMVLDVDSALLYSLEINGRLSFQDNIGEDEEPSNLTLSAGSVNVRAGELFIGNETNPYQGDATVMLLGDANAESLYIGIGINAGAKILVVTGTVKMFG